MAFCPNCYSTGATASRASIDARDVGLPSGELSGVEITVCAECDERSVAIPAHGTVIKEYRRRLATIDRPLSGAEFAYLRRALGVTGKGYAEALGVTNVTISRVENADVVPAVQDTLVRALTFLDVDATGAIERLASRSGTEVTVDITAIEKAKEQDVSGGWRSLPKEGALPTNVVPFCSRMERREVDFFEFEFEEASNADVYGEQCKRRA